MDLDQVTGSGLRQVCERQTFWEEGGSAYSQRKLDPLIFGTKMVPFLWRADPSFRNSVTGSGSRAKCSNILQDKPTPTQLPTLSQLPNTKQPSASPTSIFLLKQTLYPSLIFHTKATSVSNQVKVLFFPLKGKTRYLITSLCKFYCKKGLIIMVPGEWQW